MATQHLSEESLLLYSMRLDLLKAAERRGDGGRNPALHTAEEVAAIRLHLRTCPDCVMRLDRHLMLKFPMPGEPLWEQDEAEDIEEQTPGVPPHALQRAAAETALDVGEEVTADRTDPFVTLGGVEFGRFRQRRTRFVVYDEGYAGRTIRVTAPAEEPIACAVDRFLRFDLSEPEAVRFERLVEGGATLTVEFPGREHLD